MGAKNSNAGKDAQNGANNMGNGALPDAQPNPVLPCKKNHWAGFRLVNDLGKPVAGVDVTIKYPDNTTATVTSDAKGKFKSPKTLGPGTCEFSIPSLFNAEWKE